MNQRVFDRVWSEVRTQYYDPQLHGVNWNEARRTYRAQALAATDDRGLYTVLGEMLDLLNDDHAGASPPAVARRQDALRERRATIGVSLRHQSDDPGVYLVETVRAGSPADSAGVLPGWRLQTGAPGQWSPESDVVEGEAVTLSFVDEAGQPQPVQVTPVIMEPQPAFVADRSHPGVVVLRIEGFEPGLGRWMGEELAGLDPDTDVVLDLRGNPGGRLMEAEAVLSCFLPRDQAWATRTARTGRQIVLKTAGGCGELAAPVFNDVAVLVDSQSRSAAELTPAALQEAKRAVVIGEPTAGAVLISQETLLPDGGRLTLSRADFVTSGGVRLEKRGVTPDLVAPAPLRERRAGHDAGLVAAIAALGGPSPDMAQAAGVSVLP
ncbi:S41 family peptidase [Brevundimonas lenta]|uniref:Carboxyl-terminal processing protease n=1 Tax=Brevundimonas lenta TaxID=424796 RepID=A0A7W6JEX8_9CAUL|nr:S41 family peptidase [Brevundimonas lenta]MBB4083859.1 carboxyl-terminal processing protease [Brevundimonas lenta]